MRVGIFTESYTPLINGVSTSVRTLIAQMEQAGHEAFVFTSRYPGYEDDRPGVYRFPSFNAIVEPNYVLPIPIAPSIMAAIPGLKLDVVHSQSPFLLGRVARSVARRQGIPLVSTNHTLYTEYAHYLPFVPVALTQRALVLLMRRYYNSCDHVLAPSEMTRNRLIKGYGVTQPVTVVPTGIPAPPYLLATPDATRREWSLPPDSRVLLYVGRLAPEKNLEMLLKAFVIIANAVEKAYLVIAGSGKSEAALRRLAGELGIAPRTVFTGFLNRIQLDPLYAAADVFTFPSRTETQGLSVGEALAAGTPAVVVNEGGAPEAVREGVNGFLIPNDPAQMAELTLRLLRDPALRDRMSQAARLHAAALSPEKAAARVLDIYHSLIEAGSEAAARRKNAP